MIVYRRRHPTPRPERSWDVRQQVRRQPAEPDVGVRCGGHGRWTTLGRSRIKEIVCARRAAGKIGVGRLTLPPFPPATGLVPQVWRDQTAWLVEPHYRQSHRKERRGRNEK